jgi:hypothetical protein
MAESAVNITVDPATVNAIVTSQLKAAVASSLDAHGPAFIRALVDRACDQKVDGTGKVSNYTSSNDRPFIEWATDAALKDAVKTVVAEWVKEQQGNIRAALVKKLSTGKSDLVKAMATKCAAAMVDGWHFEFNVKTEHKTGY